MADQCAGLGFADGIAWIIEDAASTMNRRSAVCCFWTTCARCGQHSGCSDAV